MATDERLVVYFSGHVQGVGFRFTALEIAHGFETVSGCVKNLPDGRVQVIAEGPPQHLANFLQRLAEAMRGHIASTETERLAATGEFSGFHMRR